MQIADLEKYINFPRKISVFDWNLLEWQATFRERIAEISAELLTRSLAVHVRPNSIVKCLRPFRFTPVSTAEFPNRKGRFLPTVLARVDHRDCAAPWPNILHVDPAYFPTVEDLYWIKLDEEVRAEGIDR